MFKEQKDQCSWGPVNKRFWKEPDSKYIRLCRVYSLCCNQLSLSFSMTTAGDNTQRDGRGCVPTKLNSQKQAAGWIGWSTRVCQSLPYGCKAREKASWDHPSSFPRGPMALSLPAPLPPVESSGLKQVPYLVCVSVSPAVKGDVNAPSQGCEHWPREEMESSLNAARSDQAWLLERAL